VHIRVLLLLFLLGCHGGEALEEPALVGGPEPTPCEAPPGTSTLDEWGGDQRLQLADTGFFRTEQVCDRWWLVTPDGHPMRSFGVNSAHPDGDHEPDSGTRPYGITVDALYASDDEWADTAVQRLRSWGFNTAGSWSRTDLFAPRFVVSPILYLSGGDWQSGDVADWYDPAWQDAVAANVTDKVAPWVGDPHILGWFLDNEMRWGPDWRGSETLLQLYLQMPADAPGKAAAVALLDEELGGISGINAALGTGFDDMDAALAALDWPQLDHDTSDIEGDLTAAFLTQTAEHYFELTSDAVRAVDPDHMLLGNREVAIMTRPEVFDAAVQHLDVVSINYYTFLEGIDEVGLELSGALDPSGWFEALHDRHDVPILISEFGFRALDAGVPSSWPPQYPRLADQTERAAAFTDYALGAQATPWIVGWHWFEWADQPPLGRFDGENNNWGLVSLQDEPWAEVTAAMTEVTTASWSDLLVPAP
jgi:hypothetical protein